jgi:hypothetical protein
MKMLESDTRIYGNFVRLLLIQIPAQIRGCFNSGTDHITPLWSIRKWEGPVKIE